MRKEVIRKLVERNGATKHGPLKIVARSHVIRKKRWGEMKSS